MERELNETRFDRKKQLFVTWSAARLDLAHGFCARVFAVQTLKLHCIHPSLENAVNEWWMCTETAEKWDYTQ